MNHEVSMASRNIFVTGGTGFIGSHLVEKLLEMGARVCVLIRPKSDTWRIAHLLTHPNITICSDTLSDMQLVFSEHKFDVVAHLAGLYIKQHNTPDEVRDLVQANMVFPAILLELMRQFHVRSIITAGTFFEYDLRQKNILNELSPIKPYNVYARTKISFADLVQDYIEWYGMTGTHLRLFAPYGPKDNEKLVIHIIKQLVNKQPVRLTAGEQQWNFTYVTDIVDAFVRAIDRSLFATGTYDVFNIGQTELVSVKAIAACIEEQLETKGLIMYDKPYASNELFYVACDGKKALSELGWKATISIEEGLRRTLAYYLENN